MVITLTSEVGKAREIWGPGDSCCAQKIKLRVRPKAAEQQRGRHGNHISSAKPGPGPDLGERELEA